MLISVSHASEICQRTKCFIIGFLTNSFHCFFCQYTLTAKGEHGTDHGKAAPVVRLLHVLRVEGALVQLHLLLLLPFRQPLQREKTKLNRFIQVEN